MHLNTSVYKYVFYSLLLHGFLGFVFAVPGLGAAPVPPLAGAGRLTTPPTIDGTIDAAEWAAAGRTTGFVPLQGDSDVAYQPDLFAAYDNETLYVAMRLPLIAGAPPVAALREPDGATYEDDSIEVFLASTTAGLAAYRQFCVNAVGSRRDGEGRDAAWSGSWRSAVAVSASAWSVELAVPWTDLNLTAAPVALRFNVAWNRVAGGRANLTWAPLSQGFHEPERFGRLNLLERAPRVAALSPWREGTPTLTATAGKTPLTVTWQAEGGPEQVHPIPAGTTRNLTIPLPSENGILTGGDIMLAWEQSEAARHRVVLHVPKAVDMTLEPRLLAVAMDVTVDASSLATAAIAPHALKVALLARDAASTVVAEREQLWRSGPRLHTSFDLSAVPVGDYVIRAVVRDGGGVRLIGAESQPFRRPPAPEWLGCTEGLTDRVPAPWTPVQVEGKALAVWGRTIRFAAGPLPTSILTREQEMLQSPVRLLCTVDGRAQQWRASLIPPKPAAAGSATWSGELAGSDVRIDVHGSMEFDGATWMTFKVIPSRPGQRVSLKLEIPLLPPRARYLYHFPGTWNTTDNVGALPEAGWQSAFKPYVWLGDEWRGLAWYAESDEPWHSADQDKAIRVVRDPAVTLLQYDLLSEYRLDEALEYEMGFQATPVKPLLPDAWDYRIAHGGDYGMQENTSPPVGTVTWPSKGLLSAREGSVELWVRADFDIAPEIVNPAGRGRFNRGLFTAVLPGDRRFGFYWNIDAKGMRAFVQDGPGHYPTMADTPTLDWVRGQWHCLGMTWKDKASLAIFIDGRQALTVPFVGWADGNTDLGTIELGGSPAGFVVEQFRLSDGVRDLTRVEPILTADEHTLLLKRFDLELKPPDGTPSVAPAPGSQSPTEVISPSCRTVEGRDGKVALALFTPLNGGNMLDHLVDMGVRTLVCHEHWTPIQNSHIPSDPQGLHQLVEACHQRDLKLLLYWGYEISTIHPEWDAYAAECLVAPRQGAYTREPKQTAYNVCYESPWQDYIAWSIAKVMDEYGIDGVYLDGTAHPHACANALHGCGYVRDGQRRPTYGIRGARQMMKRIYTIVRSRRPDGQINVHNSLTMTTTSLGFATSTWDGEQFGGMTRRSNLAQILPLDAFRAEFTGQPWGIPAEFLCYERPYTYNQALAFTLLHDVMVRPYATLNLDMASSLWKAMEGFGRHEAAWFPYWEKADMVRTEGAGVKVSLYVKKGTALAVIANLSESAVAAQVSFDRSELGLAGGVLTAVDLIRRDVLPMRGDTLALSLPPMGWRLVQVNAGGGGR